MVCLHPSRGSFSVQCVVLNQQSHRERTGTDSRKFSWTFYSRHIMKSQSAWVTVMRGEPCGPEDVSRTVAGDANRSQ